MVCGMLHELGLGPVWEPQEVDRLGERWVLPTPALEVLPAVTRYQAHTEVVSHRPENQT